MPCTQKIISVQTIVRIAQMTSIESTSSRVIQSDAHIVGAIVGGLRYRWGAYLCLGGVIYNSSEFPYEGDILFFFWSCYHKGYMSLWQG